MLELCGLTALAGVGCTRVTATEVLAPAAAFSITYVRGVPPPPWPPWARADIYARLSGGGLQYVGTLDVEPAHGDVTGASIRRGLWAVSSDGTSIVFHHRNWRAPKSGKYPNGVHLYALGGQRRMLYGADSVHSTRSVQASVNATPQGQFPADILPFFKSRPPAPGEANDFSNHLVWALRVTGEVFPLALLGGDPLHAAAFEGRAEACLTLIRNGAAVETQTYWGFTPLDLAVNQDHEETALRLLEHGALPNTRNSAFHRAVAIGRMTLIEAMLARGASVHATDTLGETALHAAVRAATRGVRGWDFFEELASPRVMMDKNITPQVIRLLLRHGADPGQPNRDGLRPVDLLTPNPSASAAWQSYQEGIRAALAGQSASSPVRR